LLGSYGGFVPSFSEFFDHFSVKGWNVVGLATRNESIINHDFLIGPARACVSHVHPNCRPGCHFSSANKVRIDQELWTVTDDLYGFALTKEMAREVDVIGQFADPKAVLCQS